jgi:hypothetical protein
LKQDECWEFDTLAHNLITNHIACIAFQLVQFVPHKTIPSEVTLIKESPDTKVPDHAPDMIIGHGLIRQLKLKVAIVWEDQSILIVSHGYSSISTN